MFKPNVLEFPPKTDEAISLDQVNILSSEISSLFNTYEVESIQKVFPLFEISDSIKVNHFGDSIKIPPFYRILRVILESENDVDDFISAANNSDDIEYAESDCILFSLGSDPDYSNQWYLNNTGQSYGGFTDSDINAELGWQI